MAVPAARTQPVSRDHADRPRNSTGRVTVDPRELSINAVSCFSRVVACAVLTVVPMLKRLPPKKLQLTTTTIRIMTEDEAKLVVGGISGAACTEGPTMTGCGSGRLCSKRPGGTC